MSETAMTIYVIVRHWQKDLIEVLRGTDIVSAHTSLTSARDRAQALNASAGMSEYYSIYEVPLDESCMRWPWTEIGSMMHRYGIRSKDDLNLILAEYFANVSEHTFKCKE